MLEYMSSATPLAISAAVVIGCMTLVAIIGAVLFLGLDLETGAGKLFSMKMTKRQKALAPEQPIQFLEARPDAVPPIAEEPAVSIRQPVLQEVEASSEPVADLGNGDRGCFLRWYTAANLADLDVAFEGMLAELDADALEFFRTEHIRRREKFGAFRGREAMRELADANPNWAKPHAVMLDWAMADHDLATARIHLDAGLQRDRSSELAHLIKSGVRLTIKAQGKQAALIFALRWSNSGNTEAIRASGLLALAELLKNAGDHDGSLVAFEYASIVQPASDEFGLGYNYSRSNSRWALALWHYMRHIDGAEFTAATRNNVGIIYSQMDKALAIRTYERAHEEGDKYSAANLANLLIADGYTAIALSLLDGVQDHGSAAENHASARAAALAAQRTTDETQQDVTDAMNAAVEPYRASLLAALRFQRASPNANVTGMFASTGSNVVAIADGSKIHCKIRDGSKVYEGTLLNQLTCFSGWLSTGGGSILGQDVAECTLLNEGEGRLRLFRWPTSTSLKSDYGNFELRQVEQLPQLASAPQPQPQGLLAGLLGPINVP